MNDTLRRGMPIAIVTGASGGIGRSIARSLANCGFQIVAQYLHRQKAAEGIASHINAIGGSCLLVRADLTRDDGIADLFRAVDKLCRAPGAPDLMALINNAAILLGPSLQSATPQDFDSYFSLNVRAPFILTQGASLRMPPGACIVNVSSIGAHYANPGDIIYSMSKAALESLTYHSASGLAASEIRVNTVVPGLTDNGHPAFKDPRFRDHVDGIAALGGIGDPQDVANAVMYLISGAARRITGATIDVSGGSTLTCAPPTGISLRDMAAATGAPKR